MRKTRWMALLLALFLMSVTLFAALAEADDALLSEEDIAVEGVEPEPGIEEAEGVCLADSLPEGEAEQDIDSMPSDAAQSGALVNTASDFTIESGVLTSYNGSDEWVTIPNTVKRIGDNAFSFNNDLFGVKIPGTVKSIGEDAFAWCENLRSVTIGNGTTTIGKEAFQGCENMFEFIAPKSITSIGINAFEFCYDLLISGYSGSYIERYARDNGIDFEAVDDAKPTGIEFDEDKPVYLKLKASKKLSYSLEPSYAVTTLDWKSSDEKIAKVNAKGKVTAVGVGTATITVTTANRKSAKIKVQVYDPNAKVTKVLFVGDDGKAFSKLTLYAGQNVNLASNVQTQPYGAKTKLKWSSNKKSVVSVNNGKLVAQKAGTAKITVKSDNGKKATLTVTVKRNKLDNINAKPKLSAIGSFEQEIWLKSIEIVSPKKIVCEYYLLFTHLTSTKTTKFSWIEGSAYFFDKNDNKTVIFDGTVKNIKCKTKGQTVKVFKVTYSGSMVKKSNLVLSKLKGSVRSSEDFWLNWKY